MKREGLELPADFVSTVNIDLRVGALEETVTVTGESPIVDVQSARRQRTLNNTLIEALPTAQGYSAVMLLMPSMVPGGGNNNVQLTTGMIVFGGRGGRGNEGIAQTDGIGTGAAINGGGVSGYGRLDTTEEVVMTSTGGLGEAEVGGPIVNLVPRTGGNTFQHRFQASGMTGSMQSSNYTQELKDAGLRPPAKTNYLGHEPVERRADHEGSALVLLRDAVRRNGTDVAGMFYNKNAGDPTKWTYEPDLNRPARNSSTGTVTPTLRLTAQVTPPQQVGVFWDAGAFRFSDSLRSASSAHGVAARDGDGRWNRAIPAAPAQVDVHADEQAPAGGGPGDVPAELERAREAGQQPRPDSRHRTVRRRVSRQRRTRAA